MGLFKKVTTLLIATPLLASAFQVPEDFAKAFNLGYQLGQQQILQSIKDLKEVLKVKRQIYEGKLPPCLSNGKEAQFIGLKLSTDNKLQSGIYVFIPVGRLTSVQEGYLVFKLKENLYPVAQITPYFIIVGPFVKNADALKMSEWLYKTFHLTGVIKNL